MIHVCRPRPKLSIRFLSTLVHLTQRRPRLRGQLPSRLCVSAGRPALLEWRNIVARLQFLLLLLELSAPVKAFVCKLSCASLGSIGGAQLSNGAGQRTGRQVRFPPANKELKCEEGKIFSSFARLLPRSGEEFWASVCKSCSQWRARLNSSARANLNP